MTDNKDAFKFDSADNRTLQQKQDDIKKQMEHDLSNISYEKDIAERIAKYPNEKIIFTNNLRGTGLTSFVCEYSGSGDEGMIDEIKLEPENLKDKLMPLSGYPSTPLKITEYIEEFVCEILLQTFHGGWEIDDGQDGTLSWDYKTNEIKHKFSQLVPHEEEQIL